MRPARTLALIVTCALSGCAAAGAPAFFNPTSEPLGPYSQLGEANGFVFASGVIAIAPDTGQLAAPNIEEQTRQALANLDALLAARGRTRSDVVKTTVFLREPADMAAMNAVYAEFFKDHRPARTTVPGADWGNPNILVEIEAIAVRRLGSGRRDPASPPE
ncbi:MAG: RidA family protein [Hyphomonadaceae bacterium]|nr:RidA family protein [Hyphomonadaceae bacterium]